MTGTEGKSANQQWRCQDDSLYGERPACGLAWPVSKSSHTGLTDHLVCRKTRWAGQMRPNPPPGAGLSCCGVHDHLEPEPAGASRTASRLGSREHVGRTSRSSSPKSLSFWLWSGTSQYTMAPTLRAGNRVTPGSQSPDPLRDRSNMASTDHATAWVLRPVHRPARCVQANRPGSLGTARVRVVANNLASESCRATRNALVLDIHGHHLIHEWRVAH